MREGNKEIQSAPYFECVSVCMCVRESERKRKGERRRASSKPFAKINRMESWLRKSDAIHSIQMRWDVPCLNVGKKRKGERERSAE